MNIAGSHDHRGSGPDWPAILALVLNACVWGLSWWPFRQLQSHGLHPLWSTALVFAISTAVLSCWRPRAALEVFSTPALWVLVLAAGVTNTAFNWAVTVGDVVRVVLLFYLMPLWSVLLARYLLNERLTLAAAAQVGLALTGAVIVLKPAAQEGISLWQSLPIPRNLAEGLGVLGGFSFALNNVMLRREAARSQAARGWAMFAGGAVVAGMVATALAWQGQLPPMPAWHADWGWMAIGLSLTFLASNMALQFGAARLPAHITSVIMLSEVVVASGSAALLDAGQLTPTTWLGGGLIMAAAAITVWAPTPVQHPTSSSKECT